MLKTLLLIILCMLLYGFAKKNMLEAIISAPFVIIPVLYFQLRSLSYVLEFHNEKIVGYNPLKLWRSSSRFSYSEIKKVLIFTKDEDGNSLIKFYLKSKKSYVSRVAPQYFEEVIYFLRSKGVKVEARIDDSIINI